MIFTLEHNHSSMPQQASFQPETSLQLKSGSLCSQKLKQLLQQSISDLDKKTIKTIQKNIAHLEKKVYSTLLPDTASHYLSVMCEKANQSQKSYIKELMGSREDTIMNKIVNCEIKITEQEDNDKKIKRIKNQLHQKIKLIKKQFGGLAVSKIDVSVFSDNHRIRKNRSTSKINSLSIIEDLRKKQYWKGSSFSEEGKRIKSFLAKMKRQKSELESRYSKDLQDSIKKHESEEQTEKQKINEQKHQTYLQVLEKQYIQKTQKRRQNFQQKQQKIKSINSFLFSIKSKEPAHLRYQKDFNDFIAKQEETKKKILNEIKINHPNYSSEEVQEHAIRYLESKQKYSQQKQIKFIMQEELLSKRYQELRELYRSKHYAAFEQPRKSLQIEHQSLTKNREKVKKYACTVKQLFKPQVDKKKRQSLVNSIKLLSLSQDPTKRKIVKYNGSIEFENKSENDAYEKGVLYLEQLKEINQINKLHQETLEKRRDRSNSALELSVPKKIDYLRESKPSLELKPTISDWKGFLQKKNFTKRDKLQRVLDRAESLQIHAKQKQVELRNMKRSQEQVLNVKQESDKYYLESIAARMVLLKDVVMK